MGLELFSIVGHISAMISKRIDPACGNLMTFLSFIFVSIIGIVTTTKFFSVKNVIPLRDYLKLVILFFCSNLANNQAYGYNISVTLHIIFRSGSLISNMLLGKLMLKKKYSRTKHLSVIMITIGIILSTLATVKQGSKSSHSCCDTTQAPCDCDNNDEIYYLRWCTGIAILTGALFTSSLTGIYQERLTEKHGKHSNETLFYTHLLSLPAFLIWYQDIKLHLEIAKNSERLLILNSGIPILYLYLLLNTIVQYFCIKSVYVLTSECSSLTVTLVVTLRKFLSLIISILYFNNEFTMIHWLATILVFFGTLLFMGVEKMVSPVSKLQSKTSKMKIS